MESALRTAVFLTVASPALSAAQSLPQSPAPVFERLAGSWRGEGTLMGRPAAFTMTWSSAAGFAVLTFGNGMVTADGEVTPMLHAGAVYRASPAVPEAVWLDSRGVRIEIRWVATDSTLVADWSAPSESGRTTYRVTGPDTIEVVDEIRDGTSWRTFGTARYRRASSP